MPELTANPNASKQVKSPLIVSPRSDPLNVQPAPSPKVNGFNTIETPSTVMAIVPNVALWVTKQDTEPGRQKNVPEKNSWEGQIANAMSTAPMSLTAVPSQSADVPSGQSSEVLVRHVPPAQNTPPSHRVETDGMVLVVVVDRWVLASVVVVEAGAGQVASPHASQQLGRSPTQAIPRLGALHAAAARLMLHV